MAVIIEELQVDVSPPADTAGREETAAGQQEPMDERRVFEAIALESWRLRRLVAD